MPLEDLLVDEGVAEAAAATYAEWDLDGRYPLAMRIAQLDQSRRFDDWLDALLTQPTRDVSPQDEIEDGPSSELVVLHLAGHADVLRWPVGRKIMRLRGDVFDVCPVQDLSEDDELVLLVSSEARAATQREVFDMFVQNNHGLQQTARIADKWQEYVDHGISKFKTVAELTRYLRGRKFSITASAVQQWHAGRVIGPDDPTAIRLLAELAEIPGADKMATMVANAIRIIRTEHRNIGVDLRKAIALTRSRDVSSVQIGSRRFARETFDSMVQVCRVDRIERPRSDQLPKKTIKDVAREFGDRHSDRVIFTRSCERSMARSGFEDLNNFEAILNIVADGFFRMYAERSISLRQVEAMLATVPAAYAGDMSDITKGRFESDYRRLYDGEKVDISRHIKLGRAHDPRYTLRLHFHWDEKATKIVIHHAGEHLPTWND